MSSSSAELPIGGQEFAAPGSLPFDAVYQQHFGYVFRLVARMAPGSPDLDDLVQEVFCVVHRKLPRFVGDTGMSSWLFQIAHRVVRSHHRKQRARRLLLGAFQREQESSVFAGQLRTVESSQRCAAVSRAVAALSWNKRVALILHTLEGWSCERIASELGVPIGTVHSRIFHARRDIERALAAEGRR